MRRSSVGSNVFEVKTISTTLLKSPMGVSSPCVIALLKSNSWHELYVDSVQDI